MKNKIAKLSLNKETVEILDHVEMGRVTGGFTYSFSLGTICRLSKSYGAESYFECGALVPAEEDPYESEEN
jgi:hypothetical protein